MVHSKLSIDRFYGIMVDNLTCYPPAILFVSDTPSKKEKAQEADCIRTVDKYFNYSNFSYLREALNEVKADVLLGSNETIILELFRDVARLHAVYEHLFKEVKLHSSKCPSLKGWYTSSMFPVDLAFKKTHEAILDCLVRTKGTKIPCDLTELRTFFFTEYKKQKVIIREQWSK